MTLPFAEYFISGPRFIAYLGALNVFVIASVPVLSLIFLIARLTFRRRVSMHWKAGMWSFFVINLISFFAIASTQARHFNRGTEIVKVMDLSALNSDTLIIDLQENPYDDAIFALGDLQLAEDNLASHNVRLNVVKSEGENFEIMQVNISRGINSEVANAIAGAINYSPTINDNVISYPRIFIISKETKWRGQSVVITLSVPVGKTLRFENGADNLVNEIDIDRDVERPWLDSDQYWVMGNNGLVNKDWLTKNKMSEERDFKDFAKLQIEGKMEVLIEKGDNFNVSITGKENYLKRIEGVQLGETLSLTTDIENPSPAIQVHITMPSLESLDIRNTNDVDVRGFSESKMRLKNDGGYDLKAFVNVDSLTLVQDGRGEINVRGNGKHLKVDVNGYGKIDTERFNVSTAEIRAQEFSKASITATETIKIDRDKSSMVKVEGEAQIIENENNID